MARHIPRPAQRYHCLVFRNLLTGERVRADSQTGKPFSQLLRLSILSRGSLEQDQPRS